MFNFSNQHPIPQTHMAPQSLQGSATGPVQGVPTPVGQPIQADPAAPVAQAQPHGLLAKLVALARQRAAQHSPLMPDDNQHSGLAGLFERYSQGGMM